MTAAPSYILSTIEGMRTDLPHIEEALRWAWSEAWDIPTRPADEHGQVHRQLSPEERIAADKDDCKIPGPKWDLGIGNHKARHALHTAGPLLTGSEKALGRACILALEPDDKQLPAVRTAGTLATLPELLAVTVNVNWRLWFIQDRTIALNPAIAKKALREVSEANRKLLAVRGSLDKAMRTGKQTTAAPDPEDLCMNCNRRPRLRDGKRCATCRNWKHRHNGQERPQEMDAA